MPRPGISGPGFIALHHGIAMAELALDDLGSQRIENNPAGQLRGVIVDDVGRRHLDHFHGAEALAGDQYLAYLRDSFDALYEESAETPRMMSVGLHCRLVGRPGRLKALERFIDHVLSHDDVWLCRRVDIARHWRERHPATA